MKYKIGDLIVLSAAGGKNHHNPQFCKSGFGVIVDYCRYDKFPIHIRWFTSDGRIKKFSQGLEFADCACHSTSFLSLFAWGKFKDTIKKSSRYF